MGNSLVATAIANSTKSYTIQTQHIRFTRTMRRKRQNFKDMHMHGGTAHIRSPFGCDVIVAMCKWMRAHSTCMLFRLCHFRVCKINMKFHKTEGKFVFVWAEAEDQIIVI